MCVQHASHDCHYNPNKLNRLERVIEKEVASKQSKRKLQLTQNVVGHRGRIANNPVRCQIYYKCHQAYGMNRVKEAVQQEAFLVKRKALLKPN